MAEPEDYFSRPLTILDIARMCITIPASVFVIYWFWPF